MVEYCINCESVEICKQNPHITDQACENFKESKKKAKKEEARGLPPIPEELIDTTPITIDELLKIFKKYLYIEEDYSITIPLSEVIANFAPIEPDIVGIIAPSGSSKTEIIRALGELENQYCYPVSTITGHTFVSGLKENIDLAPCLRGRLLTIKDFTSILSKKKDEVSEIFADLRELTDGHIGKDFGSGVKKHYKDIHTSVLFGCTNAIEKHNSMYSILGQRIVYFRPASDKKKSMQAAMKNAGTEKNFRDELHKVSLQFINSILSNNKDRLTTLSHIPEDMKERVEGLVAFLANVRTPIDRDFKGNMATLPEPEYPTRLAKTFCKLIDAHALLYNRTPTWDDAYLAYRLTLDNIPMERRKVLSVLLDGNEKTTSEVQEAAKIPNTMAHRVLDDLKTLEIIDYFSMGRGKPDVWQLSNEEYIGILSILFDLEKIFETKPTMHSEQVQVENSLVGYTVHFNNVYCFNLYNKIKESKNNKEITECAVLSYSPPTLNKHTAPQSQKQNDKLCGICGKPLSSDHEPGALGLGRVHSSCAEKWRQDKKKEQELTPEPEKKELKAQIKYVTVIFEKDIFDKFVGEDGKTYPSFRKGDIFTLPAINARVFIKAAAASEIKADQWAR